MIRFAGLDVHRHVVEAAIIDGEGHIVLRARIDCTRGALEAFAKRQLATTDRVALEATTNTWGVVAILDPFVEEVMVSNPLRTKAIAQAKVKTDKIDAVVLAQLLRCDFLPRVWKPDAEAASDVDWGAVSKTTRISLELTSELFLAASDDVRGTPAGAADAKTSTGR